MPLEFFALENLKIILKLSLYLSYFSQWQVSLILECGIIYFFLIVFYNNTFLLPMHYLFSNKTFEILLSLPHLMDN